MENKSYTREDAYNTLNMINEWIRDSDTKTSILMAIITLFSGLLVVKIDDIKSIIDFSSNPAIGTIFVIIILAYIFSYACVFYFSFMSLYARKNKDKDNNNSIFFFGTISTLSKEEFIKDTSKIKDEDVLNDLKMQILINSKIANRKYNYFNNSLIATSVLFICVIILFILIFLL